MSTESQSKEERVQKLARKFNKIKIKKLRSATSKIDKAKAENSNEKQTNDVLRRRAVEEIMRDSERTVELINDSGPSGVSSPPAQKTNKRFLTNTMRSVINHNKRQTDNTQTKSKHKFEELKRLKSKFGSRIHSFQRPEERLTKKNDN